MEDGWSTSSSPWDAGDHPYRHLPPKRFWPDSIARPAMESVDPVGKAPFKITRADRIGTAGSCFAQHISRALTKHGFNYHVTEPAHPLLDGPLGAPHGHGMFSARYGNIYTARQLLQLYLRAYGYFRPVDEYWEGPGGSIVDPFRPRIHPGGYDNVREMKEIRAQHFKAVRTLFREMDVLVFTLGLTETWQNKEDGAVFPLCPGVAGGRFDPGRYEFVNMNAETITRDMVKAVRLIRQDNPDMRLIITVSPVPLMATMEDRNVLVSTTHSKAILRVAAEQIVERLGNAAYFPSYEIITGNFNRGAYYDADLRSVKPEGVAHVMRLFMKHFTDGAGEAPPPPPADDAQAKASKDHLQRVKDLTDAWCDEELLGEDR